MNAVIKTENGAGICDCVGKAPTYPTARDNPHFPDCPHFKPKSVRYFLAQDDSFHWFLVEASKRAEWDKWVEQLDSENPNWTCPTFAKQVGHSATLMEFENPLSIVN